MRSKRSAPTSEDQDAFRTAFSENFTDVGGFVRRQSGPRDVDAIVAETFFVAWRRWPQRPESANEVRPWLFGIARNVMRSTERHENRRLAIESTALTFDTTGMQAIENIAGDLDICSALERMKPNDREVVLLVAWEDLDTADLALALGISTSAARVRLHRARRRLRRLLDPPPQSVTTTSAGPYAPTHSKGKTT